MKKFAIPVALFAAIVLSGGFYGFIKAHSVPSLVMSSISGLILLICSYLISKEKLAALYSATFVVVILHLFFLYRFFKTFKLMPAGMLVLLSTALGAPLLSYLTKKVRESAIDA